MDRYDRAILREQQRSSQRSIAELAEAVGISPSACHRRLRALEQSGTIAEYAARLDPAKLGLTTEIFVEITLASQSSEAMDRFETAVAAFDDILECHLTSGVADYILRVAAENLQHFDAIHRECLSRLPGVSSMRSSFSIRVIKRMRGYPIKN